MRVLIVVHGYPPQAQGGSEIYAEAHAQTLRRHFDDEVLVLTREADPASAEYAVRDHEHNGIRVVRINNTFKNAHGFVDTYVDDTIDSLAGETIDAFRPDVAHIHHLTCLSTGVVGQLAERRIPQLMTLHDYWLICHRGQFLDVHYEPCGNSDSAVAAMCTECLEPGMHNRAAYTGARAVRALTRHAPAAADLLRRSRTALTSWLPADVAPFAERRTSHMRRVCDQIAHFIAPSRYLRDRFVAFGISRDRISVSDYGFDAAPFLKTRTARSHNTLRVGFLGSLMISKGPHVLLEAAARLPIDALSVTVYGAHTAYHGDDSYRDRLEPLLARPNVILRGPLAHEQVPDALASLDVLVVPSIWPENSPLVIHEAFLAGVPVIASNTGGIPELITHDVNGLLVRPGEVDALAHALARLAADPLLLEALRNNIPAVRSIDTDVGELRAMYRTLATS